MAKRAVQRSGKFRFTPYKAPPIPAGSYDPALDSQLGAAQRGLGDQQQDSATQAARLTTDYGLGLDAINRDQSRNAYDLGQQRSQGLEDLTTSRDDSLSSLGTSRDRGLADYATSATRTGEDYGRQVGLLQQSYQRLAGQQRQSQNAAGVLRGGAVLQAATKRAVNETQDRQPLDTSYQRSQQDNAQGVSRLNEDYATQTGRVNRDFGTQSGRLQSGSDLGMSRLGEDADLQRGQLALQAAPPGFGGPLGGRAFQDLNTQDTRAGREAAFYGLDINQQKGFQASAAGWVPPQRGEPGGIPKNEFTAADGTPYRIVKRGGQRLKVDRYGRVIQRSAV